MSMAEPRNWGSDSHVVAGGRGLPTREALRALRLVIFDVDGVLTDGRIILDDHGVQRKFFNVRDGAGMTFLRLAGLKVAMLTGRESGLVTHRARELSIPPEMVMQGAKVKRPAFEELLCRAEVAAAETLFVGDDLIDLPVMEVAGLTACPCDAHDEVRALSNIVATRKGGKGGVRQIIEWVLRSREDGSWERAIGRYWGKA